MGKVSAAEHRVELPQAPADLERLLRRVAHGERLVLLRDGRPVARLEPCAEAPPGGRRPGRDEGLIWVAEDFDAPLPEDVLAGFEGDGEA